MSTGNVSQFKKVHPDVHTGFENVNNVPIQRKRNIKEDTVNFANSLRRSNRNTKLVESYGNVLPLDLFMY